MCPVGFAVKFRTGRRLNLQSAEEVFALDNSKSDPIVEVKLSTPSASVDFDAEDRIVPSIHLAVNFSDNKAANELYGELDEQVDRVLVKGLLGRTGFMARSFLTIALVVTVLVMLVVAIPAPPPTTSPFEKTLLQRAQMATSDHDKLQILFDKIIHDFSRPSAWRSSQHCTKRVHAAHILQDLASRPRRLCPSVSDLVLLSPCGVRLGRPQTRVSRASYSSTNVVDGCRRCHDPRDRG